MLLDTNIVIYSMQPQYRVLREFIAENAPFVSAISHIEALDYHKLPAAERLELEQFFIDTKILPVNRDVILKATELRQIRKMTLGDSIIAATSIVFGKKLVTHNTSDFNWIDGLTVIDPLNP